MRISDWSSDVCSSDLPPRRLDPVDRYGHLWPIVAPADLQMIEMQRHARRSADRQRFVHAFEEAVALAAQMGGVPPAAPRRRAGDRHQPRCPGRSEETTSEIQSLMRTSDPVFCMHKKPPS